MGNGAGQRNGKLTLLRCSLAVSFTKYHGVKVRTKDIRESLVS